MRTSYFLCFFLFSLIANAQSISGKIIDKTTKNPLENAYIFVENSSITSLSQKDGSFFIDLKGLNNNVIVDYVGYKMYLLTKEELSQKNVVISLEPENEMLDEMVIITSPFTRKEMMKAFKIYFLGTTENGKSCKINNEEAINLYFDIQTNSLIAEAKEPLEILNKKLNYTVKFYLQNFTSNFNAKSLESYNNISTSFFGQSFYMDTTKNSTRSNKRRKEAYKNGISFFLKNLATGKLKEKKMQFYVDGLPVLEEDYFDIEKKSNSFSIHLIKVPEKEIKKLKTKSKFKKIVSHEDFEYVKAPTNFNVLNLMNKNQSIIEFTSNKIDMDKYGNLLKPDQVLFGGYFGSLKVGDMLPIDFEISNK